MPRAIDATPIAGLFVDAVSGAAATIVASTGIFAGALRALAILKGSPPDRVEWMTAVGFVVGLAFGILIFAFDLVLG